MLMFGRFFVSKRLKPIFQLTEETAVKRKRYSFKVKPKVKTSSTILTVQDNQRRSDFQRVKLFHTSAVISREKQVKDDVDEFDEKNSILYYQEFEKYEEKNKKTFLETVRVYKTHVKNRAGHVDFIKAALKHMEEHGVHKDLECYKKILNVLPKGVYVIKNRWMKGGLYYPRQQYVAMDLLFQLKKNGVQVDAELGMMIINIFGRNSEVCKMFEEILYWQLKWSNRSPFLLPKTLPNEPFLLAKIAIERITSVDLQTEVSVFGTDTVEDSIDKTWIVSGQSPKQKKLLAKHSHEVPVIVEGSNLVWLRDKCINYFILKADGGPLPFVYPENVDDISNMKSKFFNPNFTETRKEETPTVHEQDDGIIYGVCATGTSSKDSLLSWIRILQKTGNSVLADIPVLFRFHEQEKLPSNTINEALIKHSIT